MADMAQLTLTGMQRAAGEETISETTLQAEYYTRADSLYLMYQEHLDESNAAVKCCIKLKGSVLEITKSGAVRTRMIFEEGKEYLTDYVTPYGCLKMGIHTEKLECLRQDGSLYIRTEYSLSSQGDPFSHCRMEIAVRPVSKSI